MTNLKKSIFFLSIITGLGLSCAFTELSHAGTLADVQKRCIDRKTKEDLYSTTAPVPSEVEDLYKKNLVDQIFVGTTQNFIRGPQDITTAISNFLGKPLGLQESAGVKIRNQLVQMLKQAIKNKNLNTLESACLIKCSVNNLIDYKESLKSKMSSVEGLYSKGEGICTEVAAVSHDLSQRLGLKSRKVFSEGHAFSEFIYKNEWHIMDATSSFCEFYESFN